MCALFQAVRGLLLIKMKTMETKKHQDQIIITMNPENEKQKLPMNLIIPMVAGAITGTTIILVLLMGIKVLFGL